MNPTYKAAASKFSNPTESESNLIYNFGRKTKEEIVNFEFDYDGPEEDLKNVQATCGCSNVNIIGTKVVGQIDLSKVGRTNGNKVDKIIYVRLFEDQDHIVENQVSKPNPKLIKLTMRIQGELKL